MHDRRPDPRREVDQLFHSRHSFVGTSPRWSIRTALYALAVLLVIVVVLSLGRGQAGMLDLLVSIGLVGVVVLLLLLALLIAFAAAVFAVLGPWMLVARVRRRKRGARGTHDAAV